MFHPLSKFQLIETKLGSHNDKYNAVTGWFPSQKDINAESAAMPICHHGNSSKWPLLVQSEKCRQHETSVSEKNIYPSALTCWLPNNICSIRVYDAPVPYLKMHHSEQKCVLNDALWYIGEGREICATVLLTICEPIFRHGEQCWIYLIFSPLFIPFFSYFNWTKFIYELTSPDI